MYTYWYFWCSYIMYTCIGGRDVPKEDGSGDVIHLHLSNLLSFMTGADHPPPLGFSSAPQIEFTDDPKAVLPRACLRFISPCILLSIMLLKCLWCCFDLSTWFWSCVIVTLTLEGYVKPLYIYIYVFEEHLIALLLCITFWVKMHLHLTIKHFVHSACQYT